MRLAKTQPKAQVFKIHLFDFQYIRNALSVLVQSAKLRVNCHGYSIHTTVVELQSCDNP